MFEVSVYSRLKFGKFVFQKIIHVAYHVKFIGMKLFSIITEFCFIEVFKFYSYYTKFLLASQGSFPYRKIILSFSKTQHLVVPVKQSMYFPIGNFMFSMFNASFISNV